jgi:glycosyltransferase involved in cell wall biosynthesis
MKVLLVEPFFTGSHKQWAEGWQQHSRHQIELLSLPGYHWKWRMHGAAVTLSQKFLQLPQIDFDVIVVTDMLDLSVFKALTISATANIPFVVYFHENQLTYPWSQTDTDVHLKRDNHYAFINYTTALSANEVWFNSQYHLNSFIDALPFFLKQFPDYRNEETLQLILQKSSVVHLGMDLQKLNSLKPEKDEKYPRCLVLWNHRWEHDKNPEQFFETLLQLQEHGIDFRLAVLGESFSYSPAIFSEAKEKLSEKIVHWGYAPSAAEYAAWLWKADLLPITSYQDFFGASVVEAIFCNTVPLLPNRLAYPEHLPQQFHSTFFYQEGDFFVKMQKRIMDVKYLRAMNTQQWVQKYDWISMVDYYDTKIEHIAQNK